MRYAPYPLWLKLLAVFGTFLVYELTVVARNYGIGVMLMICACIAFNHRRSRPLVLALCLALMANTSVHAALAALVLLAGWLFDLFNDDDRRSLLSAQGILSMTVVVGAVGIGLWTARSSPDMAWAFSFSSLNPGKVARTIFMDPGRSLVGFHDADPAALGNLPWHVLGTTIDFQR